MFDALDLDLWTLTTTLTGDECRERIALLLVPGGSKPYLARPCEAPRVPGSKARPAYAAVAWGTHSRTQTKAQYRPYRPDLRGGINGNRFSLRPWRGDFPTIEGETIELASGCKLRLELPQMPNAEGKFLFTGLVLIAIWLMALGFLLANGFAVEWIIAFLAAPIFLAMELAMIRSMQRGRLHTIELHCQVTDAYPVPPR